MHLPQLVPGKTEAQDLPTTKETSPDLLFPSPVQENSPEESTSLSEPQNLEPSRNASSQEEKQDWNNDHCSRPTAGFPVPVGKCSPAADMQARSQGPPQRWSFQSRPTIVGPGQATEEDSRASVCFPCLPFPPFRHRASFSASRQQPLCPCRMS